jgi:serine/threonine-protein phosphatase 2A regulatory subunit B
MELRRVIFVWPICAKQVPIIISSAICDASAISFKYESNVARNFFTDIVSSYNSGTFTPNERYLAARDFLTVKIWDVAMPNKPVSVVTVQESLKSKLYEMFDNEHISDSFSLSAAKDGRTLLTGNFNSNFHLIDVMEGV